MKYSHSVVPSSFSFFLICFHFPSWSISTFVYRISSPVCVTDARYICCSKSSHGSHVKENPIDGSLNDLAKCFMKLDECCRCRHGNRWDYDGCSDVCRFLVSFHLLILRIGFLMCPRIPLLHDTDASLLVRPGGWWWGPFLTGFPCFPECQRNFVRFPGIGRTSWNWWSMRDFNPRLRLERPAYCQLYQWIFGNLRDARIPFRTPLELNGLDSHQRQFGYKPSALLLSYYSIFDLLFGMWFSDLEFQ